MTENGLASTILNLFYIIGIPIVVGVVLLVIEYRTKWFANKISSINNQPEKQIFPFGDKEITSITNLESPVGDWMQVASEIQVLVEESTMEDRTGPIQLDEISPNRKKSAAKLIYSFWASSPENPNELGLFRVYVTVTSDGRILSYERVYWA